MTSLWQDVQDLLVKNLAQKLHPALPPQQKKEGKTPHGATNFVWLCWLSKIHVFEASSIHTLALRRHLFFGRARFFHQEKQIQPGWRLVNCPKIRRKHRKKKKQIQQKGKTHFSWEIFHLQPCGSTGRWKLQRKTSGIFTGRMKRDLKVPIGKIQFEDFLTESSLVFKKPNTHEKKHNPNLPIPGDANPCMNQRLGPSPFWAFFRCRVFFRWGIFQRFCQVLGSWIPCRESLGCPRKLVNGI